MSLATDKKRWDDLHAAYAKAQDALSEYDRQLHSHYGRYEKSWLKAAQRKKLESLQDRVDKTGDKIVELIKKISPRDWMSGVPAYWIRSELTWEDAIRPKGEPLSVTPPTAWGHDRPIQEEGIAMASRKKRSGVGPANQAEAAGKRYAQEQLASDYFMEWVMEQLAEAADMDPSDTLPLATKEDALVIAGNMLQQLRWDTQRDLGPRELAQTIGGDPTRGDVEKFYAGFRETLDGAQDWLANELLRLKGEMRGGGVREARGGAPESAAAFRKGDRVKWSARLFRDTEWHYGTIMSGRPRSMKIEGVGPSVPHYWVRHEDDDQSYWMPATSLVVATRHAAVRDSRVREDGSDQWMVRYVHKISPSDRDTMGPVTIPNNAFSDSKTLGAALRRAKVLGSGAKVRSFQTEGDKVVVFPSMPGLTTYWHSIILTHY